RRRNADKRPQEAQRVDLEDATAGEAFGLELIAIDEVLEQLAEIDGRQARIVELRYFAGLSMEETAETMDLSRSTVGREGRVPRRASGVAPGDPRACVTAPASNARARAPAPSVCR